MTGADGPTASAYGYFNYNGATAIASSGAIPFVTISNSGVTNSGGTITVPNTGIYQISFGVTQDSTATAISFFKLYLNGSPLLYSGSSFPATISVQNVRKLTYPYTAYRFGMLSLTVTASLSSNDQLTVINTSGATRVVYPPGGFYGVGGPGAYINVIQLQ